MGFNSAFNPLNAELNPIGHLLALLGAHHILSVSRIRVKGLNLFVSPTSKTLRINSSAQNCILFVVGSEFIFACYRISVQEIQTTLLLDLASFINVTGRLNFYVS